jgi:hypothetical protein
VDRRRLSERRKDIVDQLELAQSHWANLHGERLNYSARDFVDYQVGDVVDARGVFEVDDLLGWIPRASSPDEMRPVAETLVQLVQTAFLNLEMCERGEGLPGPDVEQLVGAGIDVPDDWIGRKVFESVAAHIIQRRPRPRSSSFIPDFSPVYIPGLAENAPYEVLERTRQDRRIEAEREAVVQVDWLRLQLQNVEEEVRAVEHLPDMRGTIAVLGYLAATGIVFPVALMAVRPVPDSVLVRVLVVSAFVSGLVVLLVHLIRRVGQSAEQGAEGRSTGGSDVSPGGKGSSRSSMG